jgi:Glycerol uptake facilitator and related permeases (Major Intrinsic Protein Family)
MLVVLLVSNVRKLNRYTGIFAGLLVATCITVEVPLSGMSMNPARTLGSAVASLNGAKKFSNAKCDNKDRS